MTAPRPPRPLLETIELNPFGEVDPGALAQDDGVDTFYVKGYSDKVKERDRALLDVAQGRRNPKDVPTLPGNLRWTRRVTPGKQEPEAIKPMRARNLGYEVVKWDDAKKGDHPAVKAIPDGATRGPGGEIIMGDLMLVFAGAPQAARNEARKAQRVAESVGGNPHDDAVDGMHLPTGVTVSREVERQAPVEAGNRVR